MASYQGNATKYFNQAMKQASTLWDQPTSKLCYNTTHRLAFCKCFKAVDNLAKYYFKYLTSEQLMKVADLCALAMASYLTCNGNYHYWCEYKEKFITASKVVFYDQAISKETSDMVEKLKYLEKVKDKELLELRDICADTCGDYRVDSVISNPMYYLWTGMWKQTDWEIKNRRKREEVNLSICTKKLDKLMIGAKVLTNEREAIEDKICILSNEEPVKKHEQGLKLVKSDGSCDGCHYVGVEPCPRQDSCSSGEYIFV